MAVIHNCCVKIVILEIICFTVSFIINLATATVAFEYSQKFQFINYIELRTSWTLDER
jgi:hypothetical protein